MLPRAFGLGLLLTPFAAAQGLVSVGWEVSNPASSGLEEITFPMRIKAATHEAGYYFSQQFGFEGHSDIGYTGLQPRPDDGGRSVLHAVFSSFIPETTSNDTNCHDGADGGPGVSCAVDVFGDYSHTYHLRVQKAHDTTWVGTLIDTVTKEETHIGSYTLPKSVKGIQSSYTGFVEWYVWNSMSVHNCSTLGEVVVEFGAPLTSAAGQGRIHSVHEYGDCHGQQNFHYKDLDDGVEVTVGFKQPPPPLSDIAFTIPWTMPNIPSSGLADVTFPITVREADPEGRYLFSQYFNFGDLSYGGALEFQPSSASSQLNYLHAAFYGLVPGTTTNDTNCKPDQWGLATRCSVLFRGDYSHTYHMKVHNSEGNTWVGTIVDTKSGKKIHIGAYDIPAGAGAITGSQPGTVRLDTENFPVIRNCSALAQISAVFGLPFTSVREAGAAEFGYVRASEDCAEYRSEKNGDGVEVYVRSEGKSEEPKDNTQAIPSPTLSAPTQTVATAVKTTSTQKTSDQMPAWDGPSPDRKWDGPLPNPAWDGPSSNPKWDGPKYRGN
ncbi:hypothetical protein EYZ11_004697 [Aspergillus tanneri]|uniref:Uncharacterized protein n=1 Tax=Aspergillus tanneri TaxID=1220188 RepID=A0A4S3JM68_9EURO|nr:hypothetical protein EYZ11_004697 [Aspergillus tanneri]